MSNIILMCGIQASGKSTWAKEQLGEDDIYISRDEIRFNLVKEDEEYFSKEKEVFKNFIDAINDAIEKNFKNIYVDATHITCGSRNKTIKNLKLRNNDRLEVAVKQVSLDVAIERNRKRAGRARVPEKVIANFYELFEMPTIEEGFDEIRIILDN